MVQLPKDRLMRARRMRGGGLYTPAPPIDPRSHLTPEALSVVNTELLPEFDNSWIGAPLSGWDVTVTATSAADLQTKIAATNVSNHTRILLASTGDWTTPTSIAVESKDYRGNGGSLLIEPESGDGPVIEAQIDINGSRGVHLRNLTIAGNTAGNTRCVWGRVIPVRPLRPVFIAENCRYGHYYSDRSNLAQYPVCAVNAENCDDVQIIGGFIRRTKANVQLNAVRRARVKNIDIQEQLFDGVRCNAVDAIIGGISLAGMYPDDPNVYAWISGVTQHNFVDDPFVYAEHTDTMDFGLETDNCGYRALIEYNLSYGERTVSTSGEVVNVVAGVQFNNGLPDLVVVEHSNLIVFGGFNSQYQGTGHIYIERETLARVAQLPGAVDYYNQYRIINDAGLSVKITDCIASGVNQETSGGVTVTGLVPAKAPASAPEGQRYQDVFSGTFTADTEGRVTYDFTDDGAKSPAELRAALWSQFKPKGAFSGKGALDPANWLL